VLLEQGRLKYGDMLNEGDKEVSESESSSSSDDSEAKFVNPKFEKKFLEVMTAIRESNPKVLTKTGDNSIGEHLWKDDDFEYTEADNKADKKKDKKDKMTLKD